MSQDLSAAMFHRIREMCTPTGGGSTSISGSGLFLATSGSCRFSADPRASSAPYSGAGRSMTSSSSRRAFQSQVAQSGDSMNTASASSPRPNVVPGAKSIWCWTGARSIAGLIQTHSFGPSVTGAPAPERLSGRKVWYGGRRPVRRAGAKDLGLRVIQGIPDQGRAARPVPLGSLYFRNTPQFNAPDRTLGNATFGTGARTNEKT
jgi:hypothetical protein